MKVMTAVNVLGISKIYHNAKILLFLTLIFSIILPGCGEDSPDDLIRTESDTCPPNPYSQSLNLTLESPYFEDLIGDSVQVRVDGFVTSFGPEQNDPDFERYLFIETDEGSDGTFYHKFKYSLPEQRSLPLYLSQPITLTMVVQFGAQTTRGVIIYLDDELICIADMGLGQPAFSHQRTLQSQGFGFIRYVPVYCAEETACGFRQHHRLRVNTNTTVSYLPVPGELETRELPFSGGTFSVYNIDNYTWSQYDCPDNIDHMAYVLIKEVGL